MEIIESLPFHGIESNTYSNVLLGLVNPVKLDVALPNRHTFQHEVDHRSFPEDHTFSQSHFVQYDVLDVSDRQK
jgi:hypothetical protein